MLGDILIKENVDERSEINVKIVFFMKLLTLARTWRSKDMLCGCVKLLACNEVMRSW